MTGKQSIPALPEHIEVGIPADLLRRRPDVRQAELNALAQNALVGFAEADLYPSFSLTGSLGLVAGGPDGTDFGDLFNADELTYSIGPSFVWPFLNYGRIRNNVRVQDARLQRIKDEDPGAISQRRIESAEASLASARGRVDASKANVEKARQDLGQTGEQNSRILQAQSALAQARLNFERTIVRAPQDGLVTDVRVNKGNYANASAPQMTFIAVDNVWIQADFTENNLGNIKAGDRVEIVFDVLPGEVYSGTVRELGFGISVNSAPLGSLPTIDNNQAWLRAAQRYPVLVDFNLGAQQTAVRLRVGSQATVVVFTGDNALINTLARLQIWLSSILTYAY